MQPLSSLQTVLNREIFLTIIPIITDVFIWMANVIGALINLAIITIDRYLMVVHSA